MTSTIPKIPLRNGGNMPALALGTATFPVPERETVENAVREAIDLGYRHFDSASVYDSELPLGRAIARALQDGAITGREELFVTSKLWCTEAHPEGVLPALKETLRVLGLEYIDSYLIHFPVRLTGEKSMVVNPDNIIPFDMKGTWEAMEECLRLGLTKGIGVSNFTCKKISQLLEHCKIIPDVNQVEVHPFCQQTKLKELCDQNGIHLSGYSPLGAPGVLWGTNAVLESQVIKKIALSLGKTPAQVCLRWGVQRGHSVLPKSFNKQRMKENMEIFDWQLSEDDMEEIGKLPQSRFVNIDPFLSPNGFFKSAADFWDGEI